MTPRIRRFKSSLKVIVDKVLFFELHDSVIAGTSADQNIACDLDFCFRFVRRLFQSNPDSVCFFCLFTPHAHGIWQKMRPLDEDLTLSLWRRPIPMKLEVKDVLMLMGRDI